MSEEPEQKSHATSWTPSIIAMLVLYFLSAPWVVGFALLHGGPTGFYMYGAPWRWLSENVSVLNFLMEPYRDWCWNINGVHAWINAP